VPPLFSAIAVLFSYLQLREIAIVYQVKDVLISFTSVEGD